ncbi:MAG: hypothetical protein RLN87_00035 [Parasphingopyxis sp.]|uniref:hypothetical protein n=2 Tax=Parasphingopyxis TaxID=1234545 RepID=UPI0032EAA826
MAQTGSGKRPKLFVGRSDRLIARIKAMMYAWRFMEQVDGQLFMLWTRLPRRYDDESVGYTPSNIFDLVKWYKNGGAERLCFIDQADRYPEDAIPLDSDEFKGALRHGFDRDRFAGSDDVFVRRGTGWYFFSDEPVSANYIRRGVRKLFRELPIHPHLVSALERFYDRYDLEPGKYGAIHFRRGDVYEMLRNELPNDANGDLTDARIELIIRHFIVRTAPPEFYHAHVEDMISRGQKIVFTSDSPETITLFQKVFGPAHFVDLSQHKLPMVIRKAFLDFLVLTNASEIIGTASNFTQFASQVGQGKSTSVAGTGDFDIAAREFRDSILSSKDISKSTHEKALKLLEVDYTAYAKRVEEREREASHQFDKLIARGGKIFDT